MTNYTPGAVDQASRLDEIQFPEFTAKLITDTFDALIAANIRQQEAYTELVTTIQKGLTAYINETKDDIGGEMILQFLANIISDPAKLTSTNADNKISDTEATTLVTEVNKTGISDLAITKEDVTGAASNPDKYAKVLDAIAGRIASNKYTMLENMVRMGILRLVVETGVIETKLTFKTYASDYYRENSSTYNRSSFAVRAKVSTGSLISRWVKASASTSYTNVAISTANSSSGGSSSSSVEIFGRVQINFKTDYQPLAST